MKAGPIVNLNFQTTRLNDDGSLRVEKKPAVCRSPAGAVLLRHARVMFRVFGHRRVAVILGLRIQPFMQRLHKLRIFG